VKPFVLVVLLVVLALPSQAEDVERKTRDALGGLLQKSKKSSAAAQSSERLSPGQAADL
jgi:hypothetical protein